jgi:thiamine transport system permease protein
MKAFNFLKFALVFYFLIPYILFLRFFNFTTQIDGGELAWAFKNSLIQAFSAATLVTVLAIPMSLGLFQMRGRFYEGIKRLLLLPQILPSFFSILIAFSIWKPFPLGTVGITFIFTLVHLGFAVILLHTAALEKLGSYPIVGQVFGLRKGKFFKKIYFPILKQDLLSCLLMIFIFSFSSFSVPLIAGGGRDTNIEVLIFEKIFINQNWSVAWTIGIFQSLFLTGASLLLLKQHVSPKQEFSYSNYLTSSLGYFLIALYLFVFLAGYFLGVVQALLDLGKMSSFVSDIFEATISSLKILALYLIVTFILLYLWLYDFSQNQKLNFANHFIAASTMLVGFAFYLTFPQSKEMDLIKIPIAMSILVFPVLFKSFLEKSIWDLQEQVLTARVYSLPRHQIVTKIMLQQIRQPLAVWFSFLVIWFLSDFAVQKALGSQTETLGILAQGFLSSYRLPQAYLLSVYILGVWLFVLGVAYVGQGVLHVLDQKFKSSL